MSDFYEPAMEGDAMKLASRIGDIVEDLISQAAMNDAFEDGRAANCGDVMEGLQVWCESDLFREITKQLRE